MGSSLDVPQRKFERPLLGANSIGQSIAIKSDGCLRLRLGRIRWPWGPGPRRITKGALPLEEVLEVCRQIEEGLETTHENGLIHRDPPPELPRSEASQCQSKPQGQDSRLWALAKV